MPLSYTVDEEQFNSLDDAHKEFYVKHDSEEGKYKLDLADSDPDAATRAKNREKEARKTAEQKLAEITRKQEEAEQERLKAAGKVEELEASYQQKLSAQDEE